MKKTLLRETIYQNLQALVAEDGIYASGKEEVYGCIFGRDSAISILKIIKSCNNHSQTFNLNRAELLSVCRKSLLTLSSLQGKNFNPESGEEPGKFIHEYRTTNLDRLTKIEKPWYVYPDGILRNYDSIDSTPLGLIAMYKYFKATGDLEFIYEILPNIKAGLAWIIKHGDKDGDFLLEYELPKSRKAGGLAVQSWTDSEDSLIQNDGSFPIYPIAPVEVQGYAWLALKEWGKFFHEHPELANEDYYLTLRSHAKKIKHAFNKHFIIKDNGYFYAAQALDGAKNKINTITGNPLLLLWATHKINGNPYSVIKKKYINDLVNRAFAPDMFSRHAGIRTMSTKSQTFNPRQDSYHNGSFWPKLNGMAYEGLRLWKFYEHAKKLKAATIKPIKHFGTPIELYIHDKGKFLEYKNVHGQTSCKNQAWSAAVALDLLTERNFKRD